MNELPKIYLYRRIVQAKLFIDEHYGNAIDLKSISGEAYYSRFHFIRVFKQIYSKTPHQYLISVRINKARLLLESRMPVTEVCFQVGFESLSSFSGLFKKMTGFSPHIYLQQHQLLIAAIKSTPLNYIPNCFANANGWTKNSNFKEVTL